MSESDLEAARRREAARRARIRAQINQLQIEIEQLQNCKRELYIAKNDLEQVNAEVQNGMQIAQNVSTSLSDEYPSDRANNYIMPYIETIILSKGSIQSNISAYKNELNNAINDLEDAISARESKIREYQSQM